MTDDKRQSKIFTEEEGGDYVAIVPKAFQKWSAGKTLDGARPIHSVSELCAVHYFSACSVFTSRQRSMFLIRRDLLINLLVAEQPYKGL
jgi:hypothetical protein